MGRGGGVHNGREGGGQVKFYPYEKQGGGVRGDFLCKLDVLVIGLLKGGGGGARKKFPPFKRGEGGLKLFNLS